MDNINFQDPLNPREALYGGGRTNATRLFCTEGDIRYVDVCSLYPFVLKYKPIPMGHPEIITENFENISNYFGLIQCQVLLPRSLYHPVLPYRHGEKLLFFYVALMPKNFVKILILTVSIQRLNAV